MSRRRKDLPRSFSPEERLYLERSDLLVKIGALAERAQAWLEAPDLNPIVVTPNGLLVLDVRCIVRPEPRSLAATET
jgi:hypothetical protein